jgi:hypothetical protein
MKCESPKSPPTLCRPTNISGQLKLVGFAFWKSDDTSLLTGYLADARFVILLSSLPYAQTGPSK